MSQLYLTIQREIGTKVIQSNNPVSGIPTTELMKSGIYNRNIRTIPEEL